MQKRFNPKINDETGYPVTLASLKKWLDNLPLHNSSVSAKFLGFKTKIITKNNTLSSIDFSDLLFHATSQVCKKLYENSLEYAVFSDKRIFFIEKLQHLRMLLLQYYQSLLRLNINNTDKSLLWLNGSINQCYKIIQASIFNHFTTPKNIWITTHDFFLQTLKLQKKNEYKNHSHLAIHNLYKKILLLSRCRSNKLQHHEIEILDHQLNRLSMHTRLIKPINENCWFIINTAADQGLQTSLFINEYQSKDLIGLDTQKIHNYLTKMSLPEKNNNESVITKKLIKHMAKAWGKPIKRKEKRIIHETNCSICINSNSVHYHLSNQKDFNQSLQEINLKKNTINLDIYNNGLTLHQPIKDSSNQSEYMQSNQTKKYSLINAQVINSSEQGMCLQASNCEHHNIIIGDLISIKILNKESYLFGMIQWIQAQKDGKISLGVSLIKKPLIACAIKPISKNLHSKYYRAFLANEKKQINHSIIIPKFRITNGTKFVLLESGIVKIALLQECTNSNGLLNQFNFKIIEHII